MSKIKKRWWPILSIFLMVLSSFPIQTIAENLQTVETSRVMNLQLTDSQGNILSNEIEPDAPIILKFDLNVGEKEKSTWLLPTEITTKDEEIYHDEAVTLTIENNQLTVVNDNDQPALIEGVKFEFQLSDQVRSLSQVTLNFLIHRNFSWI